MDKTYNFFNHIKNIIIDITKQLLIIIIYTVLMIGLQLLFKNLLLKGNIINNSILYIIIELITFIIFLIIFRKQLIPDFYDFKKNGNNYITKYGKYWVYGLLIMIISNLIINHYFNPSINQELNEQLVITYPIYALISIIVFAPIVEESMTRIILKDTFKHNIIYYILSGFIFGFLHITDMNEILYIIPYGALGFVFAMMYKKSNNIYTNILFHSLHNSIAIAIMFIGALL